jgi:serine/threonine protein kinase
MPYCPECSVSVSADSTECPECGASLERVETTAPGSADPPHFDLDKLEQTLKSSLSPTYEILRPLGQGGMGAVFLAKELALKRLVAVKVLAPGLAADRRARARFEREARAAAAISHPNVVRVYSVGETKRTRLPYIVMQYVDGPNLEEWRLRRGKVGERDARRVIGEVAAALAAAHARDLVHRDVKPSNVLVETESGRAFVADFGVSAALSPTHTDETKLTETGVMIGTPPFMSPEQAAGKQLTPKSDVYSLGVLAYQLVTLQLPYQANSPMGWAAAHMHDMPTPTGECRPELSPAIAHLVDRCLAKSPAERPAAHEVARGMLPSLETEVEWPPPGLKWLQGRAQALSRIGLVAVVGAMLASSALTFVPEILAAHAPWLDRIQLVSQFTGSGIRFGERASDVAVLSMFLWQGTLLVGIAMLLLASIAFLSASFRIVERLIRQRRLGWRVSTLCDVLVDHDGRSGLVIGGTQDFASLGDARRRRIIYARRAFNLLVILAIAWITLAFLAKVLLITASIGAGAVGYALFDGSDAFVILAPGGMLLFLGFATRVIEHQLMGPLGRRHSFEAAAEDVSNWYASLPDDVRKRPAIPADRHIRNVTWGSRLLQVLAAIVLLVFVLNLFVAGFAAFSAAKFTERYGPRTATLLSTLQRIDAHGPIDSALNALTSYSPTQRQIPEATATSWLRSIILAESNGGLQSYSIDLSSVFGNDEAFITVFARAQSGAMPADTIALLRRLADHSRTIQIRRVAQAARVDVLAAMEGGDDSASFRSPSYSRRIMEATRANALAAVFDVSRHQPDSAKKRLGENGAIGQHLLNTPDVLLNRLAMSLLRNHSLLPLASLERTQNHVEQSARLYSAAQNVRLGQGFGGMAGLAVDLTSLDRFAAAVTNPHVPLGYRISWLGQGWAGLCAHPREILQGPSDERSTALYSIADSMGVEGAAESLHVSQLMWSHPVTSEMGGHSPAGGWTRLMESAFLGPVYRLLLCSPLEDLK